MKTDELISVLFQHSMPKRSPLGLGGIGVLLVVLCALITKFWLGLRPEFDTINLPGSFWFKTIVLGTMVILSVAALKAASVPLGRFSLKYVAVGFAIFFLGAIGFEWTTKSAAEIGGLFLLPNFKSCLIYASLYGSGASLALLVLVMRAAPLDQKRAATILGLAAGCIGGLGYSIHCPIDSPTFILVAYGLPLIGLSVISRFIFANLLRW